MLTIIPSNEMKPKSNLGWTSWKLKPRLNLEWLTGGGKILIKQLI